MMATTVALPRALVADACTDASASRFTAAILIAFVIHLFLILGVSFLLPKVSPGKQVTRPLEVIVLRQPAPSDEKPESPDAFAQVDRQGGGAEEVQEADVKPEVAPVPEILEPGSEPLRVDSLPPPPNSPPFPEPAPALEPDPPPAPVEQELTAPAERPSPQQPAQPIALTEGDSQPASDPEPEPPPELLEEPASEPAPPRVTAAQILASRNLEIAELSARIQHSSVAYAKRPRRKAISASTREYKYATYLEAWRRKVERVGNLNYPEEAKRHKMYGNLILHVAIQADGSVERVRVLRSSGFDLLDEAAVKIVELSAPFAPFPPDIRAETDVLDITRTWQFLSSNRLGWDN